MELKRQVCSIDLAKKLKELGIKQESLFYWVSHSPVYRSEMQFWTDDTPSAFTVGELGEMLPYGYSTEKMRAAYHYDKKMKDYWYCYDSAYGMDNERSTMETTEADARSKALIWLIENGHVKL